MQIAELIALAKVRSGKSQKEMATEMGYIHPQRISKLSKGELEANASEIVYLAEKANMKPIEVLAEFETQKHPQLAGVWKKTIENMRNL